MVFFRKTPMQISFEPIIEMLLQLKTMGKYMLYNSVYTCIQHYILIDIEVHPHDAQSSFQMHACTICASFDLPARASALNCIHFNGQFGCSFCEQPGMSIRTDKGGNVWTFPYQVDSPQGRLRTHRAQTEYAKQAIQQKSVVY